MNDSGHRFAHGFPFPLGTGPFIKHVTLEPCMRKWTHRPPIATRCEHGHAHPHPHPPTHPHIVHTQAVQCGSLKRLLGPIVRFGVGGGAKIVGSRSSAPPADTGPAVAGNSFLLESLFSCFCFLLSICSQFKCACACICNNRTCSDEVLFHASLVIDHVFLIVGRTVLLPLVA